MTGEKADDDFEVALLNEAVAERANVALYGATGAGKSTLLNSIFGEQVARTGTGAPVTQGTELFINAAGTLAVFDGAGLELGQTSPFKDLRRRVSRNRKGDAADLIHVAWFCVNSGTGRVEEGQRKAIAELHKHGIPVVMVFTKVSVRDGRIDPAAVEFADAVESMQLPIVTGRPVMTSALDDAFNGVTKYGLERLLEVTYSVVPEAQRVALAAAQRIDLGIKARYARAWIAGASAFAGGVGATPVAIADAALLVPTQAALLAKIAMIYDIPKEAAAKLITSSTALAASGGKIAAASLLKVVPGVGNVVTAGVAATITAVLGESWRLTTESAFTGKIDLNNATELSRLAELFTQHLKRGAGRDSSAS